MDGRTGRPAAGSQRPPDRGVSRLVGRQDVLDVFDASLDQTNAGHFRFLGLSGEPGSGKTRILTELAARARARAVTALWGRASEFEQELPLGVVIDALDDHLEAGATELSRLGEQAIRLLAPLFPALAGHPAVAAAPHLLDQAPDRTGLGRYRLYRTVRQLLTELAAPDGLALILDDLHWADDSSIELLDHLVRHPPRGPVLVAVAYRPAQASPRLAALVDTASAYGRLLTMAPLSEAETAELLGPEVSEERRRALHAASGGNPFYLEALARMDSAEWTEGDAAVPAGLGALPSLGVRHPTEPGELPQPVRTALQMELSGLRPVTLRVAQGAAAAADEFGPALAAVAADVTDETALAALDELSARDVVRQVDAALFRFRHPLVRRAAYGSAAPSRQILAHARIATHLARLGAPATERARHVERSGQPGDHTAVATLVEAAAAVAAQTPAIAAHWLKAALRLVPGDPVPAEHPQGDGASASSPAPAPVPVPVPAPAESAGAPGFPYDRCDLLIALAQVQSVSGQLLEGRETAREALRLLPADDLPRRARAARLCALMERQLDRPHAGRALLLDELRRMTDPQSTAAVTLRMRLVAESMMRGDHKAAQAVLDLVPDTAPGWEPGLELAVAALRPMPAYVSGRLGDALRYIDEADRRMAAAPDDHLTDWMDAIAWFCWTETMIGRHGSANARFERSLAVARATGQGYIVSNLLAGLARTRGMSGRLGDAALAAEEAVEVARLLGSGHQLVFALPQQSLVAAWSGDDAAALRLSDEALSTGAGGGEWTGAMARYARGLALVNAGRLDDGAEALLEACDNFRAPLLDQWTLLSCCEILAQVQATRGRAAESAEWAARARRISLTDVPGNLGLTLLAQAHSLWESEPAKAAEHATEAAELLDAARLPVDAGRARLRAGIAHAATGRREDALRELRAAASVFESCGARALHRQAVRQQRRQGARVPTQARRGSGPYGLSRREYEVASLVVEGHTNQQIAEKLFLSVRTIETHLSHIFGKLGVGSRVAVVRALQETEREERHRG